MTENKNDSVNENSQKIKELLKEEEKIKAEFFSRLSDDELKKRQEGIRKAIEEEKEKEKQKEEALKQKQSEAERPLLDMSQKMNDVVTNSEKLARLNMPVEVPNLAEAALTDENKRNIKGNFALSTVLDKTIDIAKKIANYPLKHPIKTVLLVASAAAMLSGVVIPIESIANTSAFLSGIVTGGGTWGSALSSTKALSLMAAGMPGITGTFAFLNTAAIVGVPILAAKIGGFIHSKLFNKGHELAKSEFTNMPNVSAQKASQEIQVNPEATTTEPNIQQQELPQVMQKEPVKMDIQDSIYPEQKSLLFEFIKKLKNIKDNQSLSASQKEEISNFILPQLEQVLSQSIPEKFELLLKDLNQQIDKYTDKLKIMETPPKLASSSNEYNMVSAGIQTQGSQLFQNSLKGSENRNSSNLTGSANDPAFNRTPVPITSVPRPKG
jgi:hypothetical protein